MISFYFSRYYLTPLLLVTLLYWAAEIRITTGIPYHLYGTLMLFWMLYAHKSENTFNHLPARFISNNDGDTFKAIVSGSEVKIRPKDMDAPEYDERNEKKCQPHGKEASHYFHKLLTSGSLTVVDEGDRPHMDRVIRRVYVNGIDVQLEMIKAGYAWIDVRYIISNNRNASIAFRYIVAFAWASYKKKGLFAQKNPKAPKDWRKELKENKAVVAGNNLRKQKMEELTVEQ